MRNDNACGATVNMEQVLCRPTILWGGLILSRIGTAGDINEAFYACAVTVYIKQTVPPEREDLEVGLHRTDGYL